MNSSGIISCARYAFMPNKLSYCGPDKNRDLFEYSAGNFHDQGLIEILEDFKTMYPYLSFISLANKISNPFDQRVTQAYWIGNGLLHNVSMPEFYDHLLTDHQIKRRTNIKLWDKVTEKIALGAKPHHSFHVFHIFRRTGNLDINHTLSTMDQCRISWGEIVEITNDYFLVKSKPLALIGDNMILGEEKEKKVLRSLDSKSFIPNPRLGDWISFHWDWACEKLDERQKNNLEFWTRYHINLFEGV